MDEATAWFLIVGLLFILMGLVASVVKRLPLSTGLIYLGIGYALGPAGVGLMRLDPLRDAALLERVFEVAVLVSLFTLGLKLRLPFRDPLWRIPVRLASVSMLVTIGGVAVSGVVLFDLSWPAALLLGAVLAPTDPVLASDVQIKRLDDRDGVRFGVTAEGGMNDGSAFPFVFLGLGLLGLREMGPAFSRWLAVDLVWAVSAGLAVGWACGLAVGRLVVFLRRRTQAEIGLEEFLILGLIALSYGAALLVEALGFLAVLAAGLAVRNIERDETARIEAAPGASKAAVEAHTEPARQVARGLLAFNERFERIAELVAVLLLGGLLSAGHFDARALVLALVLFVVIRPVAVIGGLAGEGVPRRQLLLMGWFGIRGVGSLYYLMFAVTHALPPHLAERLIAIVLTVVAASIVVHGISATPLMERYGRRRR
jgi:NhaP-type Na+/H+ or K+/H+ antiporter